MLNNLICRFRGHLVARNRVWNDDVDFRTSCARCGTPLVRDGGWRVFDSERDASTRRAEHPRGPGD
ncbi:MAG TPA: hypothetical protein VI168_04155 [Croceibacterium sp.]